MKQKRKKYQYDSRGQTLLEALIALTVLVIILGAVATAILTSINNSSYIKQQAQANKLAQQGMEYIRDKISNNTTNPSAFVTYAGYVGSARCLGAISPPAPMSATSCGMVANIPPFMREVTFSSGASCGIAANGLSVTVSVYWTSGKCTTSFCNSQKVTSCFINPFSVGQGGI